MQYFFPLRTLELFVLTSSFYEILLYFVIIYEVPPIIYIIIVMIIHLYLNTKAVASQML